jgi:hypothetical protein
MALVLIVLLAPFALAQAPARIESLVNGGTLEGMRWPDFRADQESVREFYAPSGYATAWVQGTTPSPQALAMIQLLEEAWKKGLDPEDYDGGRWQARLPTYLPSSTASSRRFPPTGARSSHLRATWSWPGKTMARSSRCPRKPSIPASPTQGLRE